LLEKEKAGKAQHGGLKKALLSTAALLRFGKNPKRLVRAVASNRWTLKP
jgi:hypothetical protein